MSAEFKYSHLRLHLWRLASKAGVFLGASIVLAVLYYWLFSAVVDTRREKAMIRENTLLREQYQDLTDKIAALDKVTDNLEARDRSIYGSILQGEPVDASPIADVDPALYQDMATDSAAYLTACLAAEYKTLSYRTAAIEKTFRQLAAYAIAHRDELHSTPSRFPVNGPAAEMAGATVGKRFQPFLKVPVQHTGMDFLAGLGTDVYATADGTVTRLKRSSRENGNTVVLSHKGGLYRTVYAHLGDILVREGQQVKQGTVIARVGNSGMSFLPHLHYEVHLRGKIMDPVHYGFLGLTPEQTTQVMQVAYNTGQSLD